MKKRQTVPTRNLLPPAEATTDRRTESQRRRQKDGPRGLIFDLPRPLDLDEKHHLRLKMAESLRDVPPVESHAVSRTPLETRVLADIELTHSLLTSPAVSSKSALTRVIPLLERLAMRLQDTDSAFRDRTVSRHPALHQILRTAIHAISDGSAATLFLCSVLRLLSSLGGSKAASLMANLSAPLLSKRDEITTPEFLELLRLLAGNPHMRKPPYGPFWLGLMARCIEEGPENPPEAVCEIIRALSVSAPSALPPVALRFFFLELMEHFLYQATPGALCDLLHCMARVGFVDRVFFVSVCGSLLRSLPFLETAESKRTLLALALLRRLFDLKGESRNNPIFERQPRELIRKLSARVCLQWETAPLARITQPLLALVALQYTKDAKSLVAQKCKEGGVHLSLLSPPQFVSLLSCLDRLAILPSGADSLRSNVYGAFAKHLPSMTPQHVLTCLEALRKFHSKKNPLCIAAVTGAYQRLAYSLHTHQGGRGEARLSVPEIASAVCLYPRYGLTNRLPLLSILSALAGEPVEGRAKPELRQPAVPSPSLSRTSRQPVEDCLQPSPSPNASPLVQEVPFSLRVHSEDSLLLETVRPSPSMKESSREETGRSNWDTLNVRELVGVLEAFASCGVIK
uniref:Uncharacterized protein n=1 Tax=Chromera velia CCMP2878 TaxID=1169474 RepID=A0A0G4H6E5_9ALVE|eukprot:Cvel_5765.t1-p1 / transcript=Cvel_5765.t1 / gene=Cvel_5765 / organism=Chromera_velia_CCMP2878 / gene_product=hypothetical protein / transcript_product=hypothetical protein / location=Cvel_scaffold274:13919-16390(+) / protein_length=628 / sequence_SO=supercontig / SO=protein_coding / is_pseudo=false